MTLSLLDCAGLLRGAAFAALALAGCTPPHFAALDAGVDATVSDAAPSASPDGALAEAAVSSAQPDAEVDASTLAPALRPFVGIYAERVRYFAKDGWVRPLSELTNLVEIRAAGDGLEMVQHFCSFHGGWAFDLLVQIDADLTLDYPKNLAPRVFKLSVEGARFETDAPVYPLGYVVGSPQGCTAGARIPHLPEQDGWLSGTCLCPTDISSPPAAMESDDCRITDPDKDGLPGMTLTVKVNGDPPTDSRFQVVQQATDRYINGRLAGDGHMLANYVPSSRSNILDCMPDSPCDLGSPQLCPAETSEAEFIRLNAQDEWTCLKLLAARKDVFPAGQATFPTACE